MPININVGDGLEARVSARLGTNTKTREMLVYAVQQPPKVQWRASYFLFDAWFLRKPSKISWAGGGVQALQGRKRGEKECSEKKNKRFLYSNRIRQKKKNRAIWSRVLSGE